MFKKVLIANRGEIALRVIRACRELGIKTVAVYSTADADALHVRFADEAVCIGPPPRAQSYLQHPGDHHAPPRSPAPTRSTPATASSPRTPTSPRSARRASITFIGPPPEVMRADGRQGRARAAMAKAGVPIAARHAASSTTDEQALEARRAHRLPGDHQGDAGGGGRGMRIVRRARRAARRAARDGAQRGAGRRSATATSTSSGTSSARATSRSRSLGDQHGHVDPPRRARVLDPAAPPEADRGGARRSALDDELRARAAAASRRKATEAIGYTNAGTHRVPARRATSNFYFMEMNTRIQVEHPVTEMVTGVDLVQEQIRIAAGEPLSLTQDDMPPARPRHRVPHQRRGSGHVRAVAGPDHRAPHARRPGRARRHARLRPATWCRRTTTRCSPS